MPRLSLRLPLVWVVLAEVAVVLWVGFPAQATTFSLSSADRPVRVDFSWTARLGEVSGDLLDGMWIVASEGPESNPNEEGLTFADLPGDERELRLALNVSAINSFRSAPAWRAMAFDQDVGIWSLVSTRTEIDDASATAAILAAPPTIDAIARRLSSPN